MYLQQGDVLLFKSELPKKAKLMKTNLVHKGQNHHHRLKGKFKVYDFDGKMFVKVEGASVLFHEEHGDVKLSKGVYEKSIVIEYDHWLEESRQVID